MSFYDAGGPSPKILRDKSKPFIKVLLNSGIICNFICIQSQIFGFLKQANIFKILCKLKKLRKIIIKFKILQI